MCLSGRYEKVLHTVNEVLRSAWLGLLLRITYVAVSAYIIKTVHPDTILLYLYNQSIPDDCPGAYSDYSFLVDLDYFRSSIHLLPREIAIESRCPGVLWQPISLERHRSNPMDSD